MTILAGDIKLLASKVMTDDPEGGGGPSGVVISDGGSNGVYNDISELNRANGDVSIRQLHLAVRTNNTDTYLGSNIVVSKPPNDANVSITLTKCAPFARRTEIANAIESYLIQASEWQGYLLENHVEGQQSIQIFQRPGAAQPPIGRTIVLIYNEGLPAERKQYVRITKADTETRTFTYSNGGTIVDYLADVVTCELSDRLRYAFPGSPPDRTYVRNSARSIIRDTSVADAATYYGASTLVLAGALADAAIKVQSVYSQLVPSARTESIALDQRPGAQRLLELATAPRLVQVGATPHSYRTKVGQENRGYSWVQILTPFPAPNSVSISYRALGNWYTVQDDGAGNLTGSGVGTVNYANGTVSLTTQALPDVGSSIIYSWGEKSGYANRTGAAQYRPPEVTWATPQYPIKPSSVVITWQSGGVSKTATDDGNGNLTGDGTGTVSYATGQISLKPAAMIDAGGEFATDYIYTSTRTQNVPGLAPDAGGFVTIALDEVPLAKSVSVRWVTVRNVSASSGATDIVTTVSGGGGGGGASNVSVNTPIPEFNPGVTVNGVHFLTNGTATVTFRANTGQADGTYTWGTYPEGFGENLFTDEAQTGSFVVAGGVGTFSKTFKASVVPTTFSFAVYDPALSQVAVSGALSVSATPAASATVPAVPQNPIIKTRDPLGTGAQYNDYQSGIAAMYAGGARADGSTVYVGVMKTASNGTFGDYYDYPASTTELWSPTELTDKAKTMQAASGASKTFYTWEA